MARRLLVAVLVVSLAVSSLPVPSAAAPPPVPVVLVHGWDQTPDTAWGWPAARRGSLHSRLLGWGYGDEEIAVLDWAGQPADYISLASDLGDLIEDVMVRTGAECVDVVTDCMGGLVARALIMHAAYGGGIRHLIMIAPPNTGSDLVHEWGKRALLHEIEAARRAERRYRADHAPVWESPDVASALEYVYWRAYYLYEPLYADYVWTDRMLPGPVVPAPTDFAGWFRAGHAEEFERLLGAGRGPMLPLPPPAARDSLPGPEMSLDMAYLELMSLQAGRHLYRALVDPGESLTRDWWQDVKPGPDWREVVVTFLLLRAVSFVREVALPWLAFQARGLIGGALGVTGLGGDIPWPGLVPEAVVWPESGAADIRIAANLALERMNTEENTARYWASGEGPRYTVIVPTADRGEGPLVRRLTGDPRQCLLHVAPGDVVVALPGGSLDTWRRDVQLAVMDALNGQPPAGATLPWEGSVGSLAPRAITTEAGGGLSVSPGTIPEGFQLATWSGDDPVRFTGSGETSTVPSTGQMLMQLVADRPRSLTPGELHRPAATLVAVGLSRERGVTGPDAPPADRRDDGGDEAPEEMERGAEVGESPLIRVIRTTRMTTTKKERLIVHERWEWEWAGGSWDDPATGDPKGVFRLPVPDEPTTVTARSYATDGRLLREISWTVEPEEVKGPGGAVLVGSEEGDMWEFRVESIREPGVCIALDGPERWVTGREAVYRVSAEVDLPPHVDEVSVYYYPGETFRVLWERPGTFTVTAAVNLRFSYRLPERSLYVSVIYVKEREVEVLATSVSR